jgi:23S rRNA pseudouridine1911/1915/1917 synthase
MNKNIFNTIVTLNHHQDRIDKFLQSQLKKLSRTRIQNLIKEGKIKLNNTLVYNAAKKIKENDQIEVVFPPPKETYIKPNNIPLSVLHEDEDVIIINKAPGVVIHPGAGNYENTIVNGLLFKYKNNLSSVGGKLRPGIVHRIDKDTSGAIVIAKNDISHISLSKQFSNHTVKRIYEVLVWGSLKPQNGKIIGKIARSEKNRQLMTVKRDKGKNAITNYKTIKIFQNSNLPKISLLECRLETGRTHQIRVHMNFKGNPVIGDKSYGKNKKKFKKINEDVEINLNTFNRQALHAKFLGFVHPKTGEDIYFEAERPLDFDNLIKSLEKASI